MSTDCAGHSRIFLVMIRLLEPYEVLERAIFVVSAFAVSLYPLADDVAKVLSKRCASDSFFCQFLLKFCSTRVLYHLLLLFRHDYAVSDREFSRGELLFFCLPGLFRGVLKS